MVPALVKRAILPHCLPTAVGGINVCKLFGVNSLTQTSQISKVPIMNMSYLNTESLCRNHYYNEKIAVLFF